jgi:hypothetical protein
MILKIVMPDPQIQNPKYARPPKSPVLEVESLRKPGGVPIDDVESKFRFGRYIEEGRHQSLPPSRNLSAKSLGRNLPRMADYSCSQENSRRNLVNNPG